MKKDRELQPKILCKCGVMLQGSAARLDKELIELDACDLTLRGLQGSQVDELRRLLTCIHTEQRRLLNRYKEMLHVCGGEPVRITWKDVFHFRGMGTCEVARLQAQQGSYDFYTHNGWLFSTTDSEYYYRIATCEELGLL